MRVINRTAITLIGAQPYIDWTKARDAAFPPIRAAAERDALPVSVARTKTYGAAILTPEFEAEEDLLEWVEDNFEWLFEFQLSSFTEDESAWPAGRTLKMFREWFRLDIHSVVVDVGDDDIEGEEL